jgi:transposase
MRPAPDTTPAAWKLPEAVWQQMEPLSPPRNSPEGRPPTVDRKRIPEGSFAVLRTGSQWPACPRARVGPPSTVTYSFRP